MVWQEGRLTKAWRPFSKCHQWSVHCLGDANTCGNRFGLGGGGGGANKLKRPKDIGCSALGEMCKNMSTKEKYVEDTRAVAVQ